MTDNDIIKALECCSMICACQLCPYSTGVLNEFRCRTKLSDDALRLIKSQRLEIDTINVELRAMRGEANSYKAENERLLKEKYPYIDNVIKEERTEAIKEFAERLKKKQRVWEDNGYWIKYVPFDDIDRIVKEMVGERE